MKSKLLLILVILALGALAFGFYHIQKNQAQKISSTLENSNNQHPDKTINQNIVQDSHSKESETHSKPSKNNNTFESSILEKRKPASIEQNDSNWIIDKDLGKAQVLHQGIVKSSIDASMWYEQSILKAESNSNLVTRQVVWSLSNGKKAYMGEQLLVADHLIVKLKTNQTQNDFEKFLDKNNMKIKDQIKTFGLLIIEFEVSEHDSINKAHSVLSTYKGTESVIADVITPKIK